MRDSGQSLEIAYPFPACHVRLLFSRWRSSLTFCFQSDDQSIILTNSLKMAVATSPPRCSIPLRRSRRFSGTQKPVKNVAFRTQMATPSTYSSRISTDIPIHELPGASFDDYLEDKPRVFRAIFPDRKRSHQLNEEEWRISMLPIEFLFLTVKPVVDMRVGCKSRGIEYPPGVPDYVSRVVELQIIRWELKGLEEVLKPSEFSLSVNGVLYSDRQGARTRLKGKLEMSISVILPTVFSLIPEEVRREVAESVLRGLIDNMKNKVNGSLLSDYSAFKREKSMNLV